MFCLRCIFTSEMLAQNLVKNLAKNLVKNLATNLAQGLATTLAKYFVSVCEFIQFIATLLFLRLTSDQKYVDVFAPDGFAGPGDSGDPGVPGSLVNTYCTHAL